MKILIVGAGIAGLTLAALLKQRGFAPELIDHQYDFSDAGYMLGLFPLGCRILYGLGLIDEYLEQTVPLEDYWMRDDKGRTLQKMSLAAIFSAYGPYRCFSRDVLLRILLKACDGLTIKMGMALTNLQQNSSDVRVTFSDGRLADYDLVVGADGMYSNVRRLVFDSSEFRYYDTGWGGWVWWTDDANLPSQTAMECWGTNYFLGTYPAKQKMGVILASKNNQTQVPHNSGRKKALQCAMPELTRHFPTTFEQIPEDDAPLFYWPLKDVQCQHWFRKQVVLVGDAVIGFLPTAGIGASMAMESAAVLAEELARTDKQHLEWALQLYEKRRQQRVLAVQRDSRRLAQYMLVKSPLLVALRNQLLRYYPVKSLMKSINKSFMMPI